MKIYHFILLSFLVLLAACEGGGAFVKGTITNAEGEQVVLEQLNSTEAVALDSATVSSKGGFKLSTDVTEPGFYRLRVGESNFIVLQLAADEQVNVTGNAFDLYKSYELTGSEGSEKLRELDLYLRRNYEESDSLRQLFGVLQTDANRDSLMNALEPQFNAKQAEKVAFIYDFLYCL